MLTKSQALDIVDGWIEADEDKQIEAWQVIVDSGLAWTLPGRYGRQAESMIEQGLVSVKEGGYPKYGEWIEVKTED